MKKIRPIIKWTGGKYKEFPMFSAYVPQFDKYYEPFFGGGGTYFSLQPEGKAFLNDKSEQLISFYQLLQSNDFKNELLSYAEAWLQIGKVAATLIPAFLLPFKTYIMGDAAVVDLSNTVRLLMAKTIQLGDNVLADEQFIVDKERFVEMLIASVIDKAKRLKRICEKERRFFDDNELKEHIETGIKSGFYLFVRRLTNLNAAGSLELTNEKAVANWYFVREFCYASMFRYSRKGNFNIPYGGIAYNSKNFRQKVDNIFSDDVGSLFTNADFYNLDFADFLQKTKPSKNDFIFLDPPYDSEFSEYDQNVFDRGDQTRLRDLLLKTEAKWMVVIKETEFIRSLYNSPDCRFIEFDKTYTYNVRGRNNRETKHLIIVNYPVS